MEDIREERLVGLEEEEIVVRSEERVVTNGDGGTWDEIEHGFGSPAPPTVGLSCHTPSLSLSSRALYFGFTTSDGASLHYLGEPRHLPLPGCSSGY